MKATPAAVNAVALSADGKRAVSGSVDNTLRVWDLDGQAPPRVLEGHTGWVKAVALSADGKRAVSGSGDKTLRVWDLDGQTPPRVLEGHTVGLTRSRSVPMASAPSPALTTKRCGSGTSMARLRRASLRATPTVLTRSRSVPTASAPSPALDDKTLRVWDLDGHDSAPRP